MENDNDYSDEEDRQNIANYLLAYMLNNPQLFVRFPKSELKETIVEMMNQLIAHRKQKCFLVPQILDYEFLEHQVPYWDANICPIMNEYIAFDQFHE